MSTHPGVACECVCDRKRVYECVSVCGFSYILSPSESVLLYFLIFLSLFSCPCLSIFLCVLLIPCQSFTLMCLSVSWPGVLRRLTSSQLPYFAPALCPFPPRQAPG